MVYTRDGPDAGLGGCEEVGLHYAYVFGSVGLDGFHLGGSAGGEIVAFYAGGADYVGDGPGVVHGIDDD